MKPYNQRLADAAEYYRQCMEKVKTTKEPEGQKFKNGSRVRINKKLCKSKSHFPSGKDATVMYTYAHAYGGSGINKYSLDIDGHGETSWYDVSELTQI